MNKFFKTLCLVLAFSIFTSITIFAKDNKNTIVINKTYEWSHDNNGTYLINNNGKYIHGWAIYGKSMYYFDNDGYMLLGWQLIDGNWYYFNDENGKLSTNEWIDNYYVDENGKMSKIK